LREVAVAQQRTGVAKENLQKKAFDAIIDGSNVAYYGGTNPTLRNVALVAHRFSELGLSWVVIVDASLKHKLPQAELPSEFVMTLIGENVSLTERETLERAIRKRERVHEAPAKRAADEFILEYARKWNAVVISNDKFEEYLKRFPDVLERRVTFMILEGEVAISPDPLEVLSRLRGTSATEQVSTGSDQQVKDGSVHSDS
jgi:PP-loop superfamily ATP-utilizing enzyme